MVFKILQNIDNEKIQYGFMYNIQNMFKSPYTHLVTVLMLHKNFFTIRIVLLELCCEKEKQANRLANILCKIFAK